MNYRNIFLSVTTAIILSACVSAGGPQSSNPHSNLIPMYGRPEIQISAALKKADEDFIKAVVAAEGSREKASKGFAEEGWRNLINGDAANAMRRFNQSWLLNPNYYQPYQGFGVLLLEKNKAAEAIPHFEKALSLIDEDGEKPRLLSNTARAYSIRADSIQGPTATDQILAVEFFEKANSLFSEAIKLDPQFGYAYRAWAVSLYREGKYESAWGMVKKLRELGGSDLPPTDFIDALSEKMPEPK